MGIAPGAVKRRKSDVCQELGSRLHVDDNVDYVREICELGIPAVLFGAYPWTQGQLPNGAVAAATWDEALTHIEQLVR